MNGVVLEKKFLFITYYQGLVWTRLTETSFYHYYGFDRAKVMNRMKRESLHGVIIYNSESQFYQACINSMKEIGYSSPQSWYRKASNE